MTTESSNRAFASSRYNGDSIRSCRAPNSANLHERQAPAPENERPGDGEIASCAGCSMMAYRFEANRDAIARRCRTHQV